MINRGDLSAIEENLCKDDPLWMIERHFVIHNKIGQLQLLRLRQAQKRAHNVLQYCHDKGVPARLINSKSRKKGLSTYYCAYAFHQYLTRDVNVMIIAHLKSLSETLMSYVHRFYEYLDQPFDPSIPPIRKPDLHKGTSSKDTFRLDGYQARIWVGTAKDIYAGTGETPQILLASEAAKWDTGAETAISLLQSVAMKPGTTVIYECTFNGEDALFFPEWKKAYDNSRLRFDDKDNVIFEVTRPEKWNHFVPYFTGAGDDPDVPVPFLSDADKARFETSLTEQEKVWMGKFGMSLEAINGMRAIFAAQCRGRDDIRRQEYAMTPEEAVVASGDSRFNVEKILALRDKYVEDGERGTLQHSTRWDKKILFNKDIGGDLIRYRQPKPNHRYVIGVDTAEGKYDEKYGNDPDSTVASVHDLDENMEQVAVIYGRISSENIIAPLKMLAEYYNTAFVVIENNSTGTHTCIEMAKVYPREHLYHSGDIVHEKFRTTREIGWKTTVATKGRLIGWLAEAIEENAVTVHCDKTFEELLHYKKKPGGGTEAAPGYHDDHTIAIALAVVGAKSRPVILDKRQTDSIERYYQLPKQSPKRPEHDLGGYY
uniref:Putative terminase n=1 Tax=viral metagenome TaxID=1070528 RepID=A0A6M3L8K0_9ZZZZ